MSYIKKIILGYLVLISTPVSQAVASSDTGQPGRKVYELKTREATLRIDEKDGLGIFLTGSGGIAISSEITSLWSVVIINYPPPLRTMNQATPEETFSYAHKIIEFENKYERFFRRGRFVSSEGITCTGEDVEAKGFLSGNQLGVVVWNRSERSERSFGVTVKGYRLLEIKEVAGSGKIVPDVLLPNSVRLLIYEKI